MNKLSYCINTLRTKGESIGFAESCTGGRLSALWVQSPGVSDVFMGSVVSYSNQAKIDLLRVNAHDLQKEGAVSQTVAHQMSLGVRQCLHTDWAIAITGVAGPSGGTLDKPIGTVWFSIKGPRSAEEVKKIFVGDRLQIQKQAVGFALTLLADHLKNN